MHKLPRLAATLSALIFSMPGAHARETAVPDALRPWMAWVAERHPGLPCPSLQDGGGLCVAYGALDLDLGGTGGTFVQSVTVYGKQWVALPGGTEAWPLDAREGGKALPVVLREGGPQTLLDRGVHVLSGRFAWAKSPPALRVPSGTALINLRLDSRRMLPEPDTEGVLQLGISREDSAEDAPLTMRVYRKLEDGIPMRLETVLTLSVSGRDREILTGRLLPPGSAVLSIESDVPMRIEPDGRMRARIGSGDHTVRVVSRFLAPVSALAPERADSLWPDQETWSFQAHRELRAVEIGGAPLIDPSQSGMPAEWKGLPAYRLLPGDTLRMAEKQRGDPLLRSATLSLMREMWLDFSGGGFICKDMLTGNLNQRTRLEMGGGFELGRAEVNEVPVRITSMSGGTGLEMAPGPLRMKALSRFDRRHGSLPAGWNRPFETMGTSMHLPPGWKLIHAEGPDRVDGSWVSDWTLWEIFLLCILVIAVLRLAGRIPALLALACFVLLAQEEGLPGLLWLNLLVALGLCAALPAGRLRVWAGRYRAASLLLLAALWIPFAIAHARKALYPQLDGPGADVYGYSNLNLSSGQSSFQGGVDYAVKAEFRDDAADQDQAGGDVNATSPEMAPQPAPMPKRMRSEPAKMRARAGSPASLSGYGAMSQPARVQSGPGEPEWGWETARFSWSGPVREGEALRLYLLRPWLTRLMRILQAALPALLLLLLAFPAAAARLRKRGGGSGPVGKEGSGPLRTGALGLALALLGAPTPARADFPPDTLLRELESRMLAPRACAPACVTLGSAQVRADGDRLRLELLFDAADTALALLPQAGKGQLDIGSLKIGGRPAFSAARLANGRLAVVLPPGRHAVSLEGRITGPRLEIDFGGDARNLSVQAPGYSVQGPAPGRADGGALVLQRRESAVPGRQGPTLAPDPAPAFVEIRRTVVLDQEWILETRVQRVAPSQGAFSVEVPVLPFEHPLTPGLVRTPEGILISFREGQDETSWRSAITKAAGIKLAAGSLERRAETWSLVASSRWHVETSGIPPVFPREGSAASEWRPLPGDTLSILISEPGAAAGPVKTVEHATLTLTPGRRESAASLALRIRAGQGDVTRVKLPAGARLENLVFDGQSQAPTQREGAIGLTLHPGLQHITLAWKQPEGIGLRLETPAVEVEGGAANVSLVLNPPGDRWILWAGGVGNGPALLLWGALAVLTALAFALGRSRLTPLGIADWTLLFAGTSTVNIYATAPLLVFLLAMRHRSAHAPAWSGRKHNAIQIGLAALGILAFGLLLAAVPEGLLGTPEMQITGNGSNAGSLRWFLDRSGERLPTAWMLSLPLWVYRVAMLAWSLWLAFRLLGWLRWSWENLSSGGLWRQVRPPKR